MRLRLFVEQATALGLATVLLRLDATVIVVVFGLVNPAREPALVGIREMPAICHLPAVARHAHAFALGGAVEPSTLLEVLLAPDTLGIAESSLGERVDVSPTCHLG